MAIKTVFGDHAYKLAVSSTKSMVGHMLGGAGAIGAAATALSLHEQRVHPTINYINPDPKCDLDCVPNTARDMKLGHAMCGSAWFRRTQHCSCHEKNRLNHTLIGLSS